MAYNPNIHHRKSIRLKGYDYTQAGLYFITLCVQNRECLFGEIKNGEMLLNVYGKIALEEWYHTEQIRGNCRIYESVVMPNHIHGIIEITHQMAENKKIGKFQSPSNTIGSIIRGFKIATIKRIKDHINNSEESYNMGELRFALKKIGNNIDEENFGLEEIREGTGELQFAPTEIIKSLDFKIWQRNYYEHIIRNEQALSNISNYIINNPKKWEEDKLKK